MKIKNIRRNPFVTIASIVILSALFSLNLYSTFCTLEQNIDWNAINAIASIVMAIITVVAVYVAIYIPKEDRIISAKIELFEYRYQSFCAITNSFISAYGIERETGPDIFENLIRVEFLINSDEKARIIELYKSITEKGKEKDADEKSFSDISPELKELKNIFIRYIDLHDHGINVKE